MEHDSFKVLVVDDSVFNQEALRRILVADEESAPESAPIHYTILTAKNGNEALDVILTERPDLVLLDIIMPGMSGFEVLDKMHGFADAHKPPVIVISGLDDEEDEEKGFMLGAVDYITKPFKKSIVMARIRTHLKIVEQLRIIEELSTVDSLTGIPNRRGYNNHMAIEWGRAIRDNTPLGVLMIDIDKFKLFNDTYGHQQGDIVLQVVAKAIRDSLKRSSDMAARWGGEEFVVLLPNTEIAGALIVAEQVRGAIEAAQVPSLHEHDTHLSVTASIGAATVMPTADDAIADLIERSDKALYMAKETGRNRVCWDS